jgi:hypothetical protein
MDAATARLTASSARWRKRLHARDMLAATVDAIPQSSQGV